ncbi:hypothetical protein MTO96_035984 [Rhipicephalus appendiculatus]
MRCGSEGCLPRRDIDCYRMASEGAYVAMTTCGEYDVLSAAEWGLVPGEQYGLYLQTSPMRLDHPLRYQHRRLFLAVSEAGLAKPFMRHRPHESKPNEEESSATLLLFCAVYGLGVFVSAAALMSEVLWHKWVNRRRNSRALCWRLRLPWPRTATVRPFSA